MKKILIPLLSFSLLLSCGVSKEELTEQVKKSIQEEVSKNEVFNIEVVDLTLIKKSDVEYTGILKTRESLKDSFKNESPIQSMERSYNIEVTTDGDNFKWEIKN